MTCPSCHRTFRVPDRFAGRRSLCPDCQSVVTVPDAEPPQLDPLPDEPYRHERPRRPTPLDHLPAWRRVATGFLVQQAAAAMLLSGLVLLAVSAVVLAEDPGNFQKEPTTAQLVTASLGLLALFVGFAIQTVGRLISAGTPVRAPRALGILSAIASVLVFLGSCLLGLFLAAVAVQEEQGNAADEALATVAGLSLFAWMFLAAGGETFHGLAVGTVGRVLRADGARALGNALGIGVAVVGLVAVFAFCGLSAWVGNNNPQNPDPTPEQSTALLAWVIGCGLLLGLYLLLDLVLLHRARAAVARLAARAADEGHPDDRWD